MLNTHLFGGMFLSMERTENPDDVSILCQVVAALTCLVSRPYSKPGMWCMLQLGGWLSRSDRLSGEIERKGEHLRVTLSNPSMGVVMVVARIAVLVY